jgi:hypothetical protein
VTYSKPASTSSHVSSIVLATLEVHGKRVQVPESVRWHFGIDNQMILEIVGSVIAFGCEMSFITSSHSLIPKIEYLL